MKIYQFADMIDTFTIGDIYDAIELLDEAELREKLREYWDRLPQAVKEDYKLDYIKSPVCDIIDAFNEVCDYDDKFYFIVKEVELNITTED